MKSLWVLVVVLIISICGADKHGMGMTSYQGSLKAGVGKRAWYTLFAHVPKILG